MSNCQELQEKISQLKDLKQQFEQIYHALPPGSNREPAKKEVLAQANEKRDGIELMIEQIEKLFYWKVIKLGTHKTIAELRQVILDQGNEMLGLGEYILDKIHLSQLETEIALYVMTVKELTGKDRATTQEVHDAIKARGGELCPAEVGPQLRLQYLDQPMNEHLLIAMDGIVASGGELCAFFVERDGLGWFLSGRYVYDSHFFGDALVVFTLSK